MAESELVIPINSTAGSIEGSKRAATRERELKLRAACEDGDFERYKELAIETWPMIVGGVPKVTKHCADLLNVPDVPMIIVHDNNGGRSSLFAGHFCTRRELVAMLIL